MYMNFKKNYTLPIRFWSAKYSLLLIWNSHQIAIKGAQKNRDHVYFGSEKPIEQFEGGLVVCWSRRHRQRMYSGEQAADLAGSNAKSRAASAGLLLTGQTRGWPDQTTAAAAAAAAAAVARWIAWAHKQRTHTISDPSCRWRAASKREEKRDAPPTQLLFT